MKNIDKMLKTSQDCEATRPQTGLPGHVVAKGIRAKEIFFYIVPLDPA